jgi:hypothetical protein
MSTSTPTTEQGQAALALAHLKLCSRDLTAARKDAIAAAAVGLTDARRIRVDELAVKIADALDYTRQLSTVLQGDLRAQDEPALTDTVHTHHP